VVNRYSAIHDRAAQLPHGHRRVPTHLAVWRLRSYYADRLDGSVLPDGAIAHANGNCDGFALADIYGDRYSISYVHAYAHAVANSDLQPIHHNQRNRYHRAGHDRCRQSLRRLHYRGCVAVLVYVVWQQL